MALAIPSSLAREPLSEMNTTPLIDVLLVLLIVMVMAVPLATNSLEIALPGQPPVTLPETYPVRNELGLRTDGQVTWNGVPAGDLYFLVVSSDGAGNEGSWGHDSFGGERNGPLGSGACGTTSKDTSALNQTLSWRCAPRRPRSSPAGPRSGRSRCRRGSSRRRAASCRTIRRGCRAARRR